MKGRESYVFIQTPMETPLVTPQNNPKNEEGENIEIDPIDI